MTRKEAEARPDCKIISFPDQKRLEQERLKENLDKRSEALEKEKIKLVETMREVLVVESLTGHGGLCQRVYLAFDGVLAASLHLAQAEVAIRKEGQN